MLARALVLVVLAGCAEPAAAQVRTDERVTVARVLVDVRVTNRRGQPIRGLTAPDFHVNIDGRPARVESVSWIGFGPAGESVARPVPGSPAGDAPRPPAGRLTVFLFQKSIEASRIGGFLRMMKESARFVDRLGPADRAAVMVFDSRLRLWQDFTSDHARLAGVLGRGVLFERPDPTPTGEPSLAAVLDRTGAERAATMEEALEVIARALEQIDGAKSLVLFGHGFGTYASSMGSVTGRAVLGLDYERARAALIAARVTVFAMDVTDADSHTLETGLMTAAEDTGGFYMKVHKRQAPAMDRLEGALDGCYVLAVETPAARAGQHEIRVRADAPKATVEHRRYYVD